MNMYLLRSNVSLQVVGSTGPFNLGPVSIKVFDYPTYAAFATPQLAEQFRHHLGLDPAFEVIHVAAWLSESSVPEKGEYPKHVIYFESTESLSKYFQNPAEFDFGASVLPLR